MIRHKFYITIYIYILLYRWFYDILCVMLSLVILVYFHVLFFIYWFSTDIYKEINNGPSIYQFISISWFIPFSWHIPPLTVFCIYIAARKIIIKHINYNPKYFINSCSYQTKRLMMSHITHEFFSKVDSSLLIKVICWYTLII